MGSLAELRAYGLSIFSIFTENPGYRGNGVDPDKMLSYVASVLGLHQLPMPRVRTGQNGVLVI